jgi:NADH dehydrogenase FAD-containing subunit
MKGTLMNPQPASPARRTRVVVVGAGYAGLMATNRFLGSLTPDERAHVQLTVINPRDHFVERIRLHQLAAGSLPSVTKPLGELLHPDAIVVRGTAEVIDPLRRAVAVRTSNGHVSLAWDHLVYAVGSIAAAPVAGAREHGFLLADLDGAERAAAAITGAGPEPRVLVVGAGLTGVEAAAEVAERLPSAAVTLMSADTLLPAMRPAAQAAIKRTLRRLGVAVVEHTPVAEVTDGYAITAHGEKAECDVCLVALSFDVPGLAGASGLTTDATGRLVVDETLRSVGCASVLGAGDAVAVGGPVGAHLRMACSVAVPMGGHVAHELLGHLRGAAPTPFDMGFTAQCISLGRRHGYFQPVNPDDTPRRLHVGGSLGARIKEAVCRRVVEAPAAESARPGTYTWRHNPQLTSHR